MRRFLMKRCVLACAILPPPSFRSQQGIVGFLDDLKRQADALKAQQTTDTAALERNAALTEAACKTVFGYFNTLAPQLEVLRPTSPARFVLDRQHVLDGLKACNFRLDSRRKRLRNDEVFDHIVLHWELRSGRALELTKDFLPDIERLESRLRQSGARVDQESLRDPASGKLQAMRYRFVADFHAQVRITPQHDAARLHVDLRNIDGLESVGIDFAAIDVGSARLDELARWLVGQPHAFLNDAMNLRRVEP